MRSMLSRLGFVGLWVAGSLLPGTLDLFRSPQRGWGTAVAQASEMQEQWQLLQDAQAAYQRGIQAVQRGDSTAAETAWAIASAGFRRIIKDNPQHTDLFVPLADIQIRRGQPAAAYALLIQAVRAGAKDLSVRIEVVRALQAMRRPQKALAEAQELQRSTPNNPELMTLVGELADLLPDLYEGEDCRARRQALKAEFGSKLRGMTEAEWMPTVKDRTIDAMMAMIRALWARIEAEG